MIAMSGAGAAKSEGPYTYDPYGNCFLGATANPCTSAGEPYRFTGRRFDPETGLYYYRARYYSAALGRFLQTDPVGYTADPNLYAYVGNDPTDKTDPTGLAPCIIASNGPVVDCPPDTPPKTEQPKQQQELRRPYIRQNVRRAVEQSAPRNAEGKPIDPNTGKPIEGKPDLGHKTGQEFRTEKSNAQQQGMSQKQFNEQQNNPNKYQLEDPSSNRSHQYEAPRPGQGGPTPNGPVEPTPETAPEVPEIPEIELPEIPLIDIP